VSALQSIDNKLKHYPGTITIFVLEICTRNIQTRYCCLWLLLFVTVMILFSDSF